MKLFIYKLSLLTLIACALTLAPAQSYAQEKKAETNGVAKKAPNPNRAVPFHGTVDAVDKTAKTLKVGERVFNVSTETRIKKDEKPGTLGDAVVGEAVRGSYRKTEDGKLQAISLSFGQKPAESENAAGEKSTTQPEKLVKKQPKNAQKTDQKVPE